MTRRLRLLPLLLSMLLASSCGDEPAGGLSAPGPATAASPPMLPDGPAPQRSVTLLWPGGEAQGLVPREAQIFATRDAADQARQIVGILLSGAPDEAVLPPFPAGTALTSLFVDERGIAYVSLSKQAMEGAPGGSTWERMAVHSLVGSLTRGVPQIRRVQLLIDGKEIESLAGHLDMRGPIVFDEGALAP